MRRSLFGCHGMLEEGLLEERGKDRKRSGMRQGGDWMAVSCAKTKDRTYFRVLTCSLWGLLLNVSSTSQACAF